MRRIGFILLSVASLAVACEKFGGEDDPVTPAVPSADAGTDPDADAHPVADADAGADAGADVAPRSCPSLHPSQCNGVVSLIDLTTAPVTQTNTTHSFSTATDPCGELNVTCVKPPVAGGFSAYYTHLLDNVPLHFVLHQQIRGPVSTATGGAIPLTFGCGLFLTTTSGDVAQARFEASNTNYEIDGEDTAGNDPPGVPFKSAGDPMPDTKTTRSFDLEVTIVQPKAPPSTGTVNAKATIDGKHHDMNALAFAGTAMTARLECGLLQADAKQAELCDLTIRQIELEVCQP